MLGVSPGNAQHILLSKPQIRGTRYTMLARALLTIMSRPFWPNFVCEPVREVANLEWSMVTDVSAGKGVYQIPPLPRGTRSTPTISYADITCCTTDALRLGTTPGLFAFIIPQGRSPTLSLVMPMKEKRRSRSLLRSSRRRSEAFSSKVHHGKSPIQTGSMQLRISWRVHGETLSQLCHSTMLSHVLAYQLLLCPQVYKLAAVLEGTLQPHIKAEQMLTAPIRKSLYPQPATPYKYHRGMVMHASDFVLLPQHCAGY